MALFILGVVVVQPDGLQAQGSGGAGRQGKGILQFQAAAVRVQIPAFRIDRHIVIDQIFSALVGLVTILSQGDFAVRNIGRGGILVNIRPLHSVGIGVGFSFIQACQRFITAHINGVVYADDAVLELPKVMQCIIAMILSGAVEIVPGFYRLHFTGDHVVDPYILIKCTFPVKLL